MLTQTLKKLALIHYAYPPNIGGVEEVLYQQANFLSNHNFDVTVLTGEGQESNSHIKLVRIPELQSVMQLNPALQDKILKKGIIDDEFYQLASTIEQKISSYLDTVDCIIVHNMMTLSWNLPFSFAFSQYAKKNPKKKILIWVHDHMLVSTKSIDNEYHPQSNLENDLLTTPLANATYIFVSNIFKENYCQAINIPKENVLVIPNGISLPKFLSIEDTIWHFIKEKKILTSFPILFSPVNLVERKNIEYSLDILNYLKTTYPHALLLISGHPSIHRDTRSYVDFLKEKILQLNIQNNTIFLWDVFYRNLTSTEIHSLYRLIDVVLYFSKSENFGLPLLESALAKTLIVTSNLEVFHEIAGKNLTAIDASTVSAKEAASKLTHMIEENSIMQLNYKVRKDYNLETILSEYLLPLLNK